MFWSYETSPRFWVSFSRTVGFWWQGSKLVCDSVSSWLKWNSLEPNSVTCGGRNTRKGGGGIQILATRFVPYRRNRSELYVRFCEPLPLPLKFQTKTSKQWTQILQSSLSPLLHHSSALKWGFEILGDPWDQLGRADFSSLKTPTFNSLWLLPHQPGL